MGDRPARRRSARWPNLPANCSRTRLSAAACGAEGRRRSRGRLRLRRLSRRDQRARVRRAQLRRRSAGRGGRLRAPPRLPRPRRAQHVSVVRWLVALGRRGRPGRGARGGRDHLRRRGPARLRGAHASDAAAASVGAGVGDQLRGHQLLPRTLWHPARRPSARALARPGPAHDRPHRSRDRGLRLRQSLRDGRGAVRAVGLRDRLVAQLPGRLLAGEGGTLGGRPRRHAHAAQRFPDRCLQRSRAPGYPTLCKGRFEVEGETYYAFEEPTSLNTLDLLPQLCAAGIRAIKIEGRQRSPPTSRR